MTDRHHSKAFLISHLNMKNLRILFVCMGNICRSPTAEAVFRHKAALSQLNVHIDSAGTTAYHVGEAPDARSRQAGEARSYSFAGQVARQVMKSDFRDFDHIYVMDAKNLAECKQIAPVEYHHKLALFLSLLNGADRDVPDPYYGETGGFEEVLDLIEQASDVLVKNILKKSEEVINTH